MSLISAWEWKREAESPLSSSPLGDQVVGYEDVWLFDVSSDVVVEVAEDGDEMSSQSGVTRAQVAAKLLDDLDEMVKEEPFSDFCEDRIDLPIFEDLPLVGEPSLKYKSLDTQTLLREFDDIYGEVELNNSGSFLTPPQSPPLSYQPPSPHHATPLSYPHLRQQDVVFLNTLSSAPHKSGYVASNVDDLILLDVVPPSGKGYDLLDMVPAPVGGKSYELPHPDVATELAAVDELLRTRAEDMDVSVDPWETGNASSPLWESSNASSPPWESGNASGSVNDSSESDFVPSPGSSGSDNSNSGDVSNDPEWIPETVHAPKAAAAGVKRKRGKPYGRPVEDKKLRKKEQNKNAATRYRQKKKQEVEVILDEEKIMEEKNEDLKEKVTDLQREIRYLKGLMRDLFKAKGILK